MTAKTRLDALAVHYDSNDTSAELEDATEADDVDTPAAADRMTTFAVRLPLPVLERVREIAEQNSVTTSAMIRRWIDVGIAEALAGTSGRVVPVEALLELIGRAPREAVDGGPGEGPHGRARVVDALWQSRQTTPSTAVGRRR